MCGRFTLTIDPAESQETFSEYTAFHKTLHRAIISHRRSPFSRFQMTIKTPPTFLYGD